MDVYLLHKDLAWSKPGRAFTCGPCKAVIEPDAARAIHRWRKYPVCIDCAKAYKQDQIKPEQTDKQKLDRALELLEAIAARLEINLSDDKPQTNFEPPKSALKLLQSEKVES